MGNFGRRLIALIVGIVIGVCSFAIIFATASYWAFKKVAVPTDNGELTVEEIVALIVKGSENADAYTVKVLNEKYGINTYTLLENMGLDLSTLTDNDRAEIDKITPLHLLSDKGFEGFLNNLSFQALSCFIPSDGFLSVGARTLLNNKSLAYLTKTAENGNSNFINLLGELKLGSLFPSLYDESFNATLGEYEYFSETGIADIFSNVQVSFITGLLNGEEQDVGYAFNEGGLKDIGGRDIVSLLTSITGSEDLGLISNLFKGKNFKDLWIYENGEYSFSSDGVFGDIKIGLLFGYTYCDGREDNYDIEHTHEIGWYLDGVKMEESGYQNLLMSNLYNMLIVDVMGDGISQEALVKGIYMGDLLSYTISEEVNDGYCLKDCDLEHGHNFYWIDKENKFVGQAFNKIANALLSDFMAGTVEFDGLIKDIKVGELLGAELVTEGGVNVWRKDGAEINYDALTRDEKILFNLYDYTVNDLTSGSFNAKTVFGNMYVGELMSYTLCTNVDGCPVHGSNAQSCDGKWYKTDLTATDEVTNLFAGFLLGDLLDGNVDIKESIKTLTLSSVITIDSTSPKILQSLSDVAISKLTGKFNTLTLNEILDISESDGILYALKDSALSSFESDINGVFIGEVMGYEKCSLNSDCPIHALDASLCDGEWYENTQTGYQKASSLMGKFSNLTLEEIKNGGITNLISNSLTLKDALPSEDFDSGIFSILYLGKVYESDGVTVKYEAVNGNGGNVLFKEVGDRITKGFERSSYAKLKTLGILNLGTATESKLDAIFTLSNPEWKNDDITTIITSLVDLLYSFTS